MMPPTADDPGTRWTIRPAGADDAAAITSLLNAVFGNWGSEATWSWKYQESPAPYCLMTAVAEANGRLVGHYGIVPLSMVQNGKVIHGAQAVDAAVLPEFRRRGILFALAKLVLESAVEAGASFIYAFPGLYSLSLNRRIGFQPVMVVPEMVRLLSPGRFLCERVLSLPKDLRALWSWQHQHESSPDGIARLANFRSSCLWMLSWLSAPVWQRAVTVRGFTVRRLAGFDAAFDQFSSAAQAGKNLGLVKGRAYLSWRYQQHPDRAYLIWGAFVGENLVGYLVLHIAEFKSSICELETLPGNENAVFVLVEAAGKAAREAGSNVLGIWVPDHNPLHSTLQKCGFISQRRLHHWLAKRKRLSAWLYQIIVYAGHLAVPLTEHFLKDIDHWSLAMGDSDLV